MTPGDLYLDSLDRDDPSAGRTKLGVLRETMKTKGCEPHLGEQHLLCARRHCPSFTSGGWTMTIGCRLHGTLDYDGCPPMLAAMVEALQVPHE